MRNALKALGSMALLATVVFILAELLGRRYEVDLIASSIAIYAAWQYFEGRDMVKDPSGCLHVLVPIVIPILLYLLFSSVFRPPEIQPVPTPTPVSQAWHSG